MTALALPAGLDAQTMAAARLADKGPIDPGQVPCAVCSRPPAGHNDDDHPHQVPAEYALAAAALAAADRPVMDDIVEHLAAEHVPSGRSGPRVSDAGACSRQIWYRERPPAGYVPRTGIDQRRASLGALIHKGAEAARSARYPWRRYEMAVDVPGLDRPGRVDEYDPVLGLVIDDKTAGRAKWDLVGDGGPTGEQWAQLRIYGYALDAAGWPVRTLRIIAINRDSGAEEHFNEDFDPALGLAALDQLVTVATMVEAGMRPPRGGYGPRDWRCQWCPALDHCWNTRKAAELGRSPESVTILGERPEDPSIAWAAREVLAFSKQRLEVEKREDRAKALLQGVPPGTYGADSDDPVELYLSPSTSYGYKAAYGEVLGLVNLLAALLPDDVRPELDDIDVPVKKSFTTAARRPRAAGRKRRQVNRTDTP